MAWGGICLLSTEELLWVQWPMSEQHENSVAGYHGSSFFLFYISLWLDTGFSSNILN